jgi:hypothetical protein
MADKLKRINALQRKIIVASIAYYEYDERIMSDYDYDAMVQKLKELMDGYPEKERSRYWYAFEEWTGATGCFLRSRLNPTDRTLLEEAAMLACEEAQDYRAAFL